jgi:prepilin-type N-terminal cleavage/methylation domain-containing protein
MNMKTSLPTRNHQRQSPVSCLLSSAVAGFTLIELLTVIAIIAILVSLLFPAIKVSLAKAEVLRAQTTASQLATAFKAYYTEFGYWPSNTSSTATSVTTNMFANSRNYPFFEFSAKNLNGNVYNGPWGQPFLVACDPNCGSSFTATWGSGTLVVNASVGVWTTNGTDRTKLITSW